MLHTYLDKLAPWYTYVPYQMAHTYMPYSVAGMLLTDLKGRSAESADEVRGISDILLQRVSEGGPAVGEVTYVRT